MNTPAMPSDTPEITVVVVVGNPRRRARRAVESILEQPLGGRLELLVVDMADPLRAEPFELADDRVRTIKATPSATFGGARASAVRAARGRIVAFLEEHCIAMPGWAEALVQAHAGPWAAVGAEVHNGNPGVGWSDAIYLTGYSLWMPPAPPGQVRLTATHNTSYKKSLLLEFGDRLAELLTAEPLLQQDLLARGHRLYLEPQAKFRHLNETSLRSSAALYWWNRSLGRIRVANRHPGMPKRVAHLILVPVVPVLRLGRLIAFFMRRRRRDIWTLLRQAPRIIVIDAVAATGLALGMLLGKPADDMRFTEFELRGDREER
jgi:hypothetical protein